MAADSKQNRVRSFSRHNFLMRVKKYGRKSFFISKSFNKKEAAVNLN
jgi:hypothetical protein